MAGSSSTNHENLSHYPPPLSPGEREMTGNSKHQFQMTKTTFHFVELRPLEVICDLVLACLPVGREFGA